MNARAVMPDGSLFPFWDDRTGYRISYHVACGNSAASDDNPGTEQLPFRTINRAAAVLKPGEKAVIHEGIYRECIKPARGGDGPGCMIAYEAAPGEKVIVSGAVEWKPAVEPSAGFKPGKNASPVWMADLPA